MTIYKLGEILKSNPKYGANQKALDTGKYRYFRQTDINNGNDHKFVDEHENSFLKKGDLLISRAGAGAGTPYFHNEDEIMVYAGYLVKYEINDEIAIAKYIYLSLLNKKKQINSLITGAAQPNFNPPSAVELIFDLPNLIEQQKIIDIIEPIEKLYLKYPNIVDISNFENAKNDIGKLIDIIEPIDDLKFKYKKLISKLEILLSNRKSISKKIYDISKIRTKGYPYKKEDYKKDGNFKVFKTKNILSKNFDKTDLIVSNEIFEFDVITGLSGTVGTAIVNIEKNVVGNQRTLTLMSDYSYNIKSAIYNSRQKLLSKSTGSAQPNITVNDILELDVNVNLEFDAFINKILYVLYKKIDILERLNDKMIDMLLK